jgi:tRNA-2-methylthio-N6-dimethylallyladenosine synthase
VRAYVTAIEGCNHVCSFCVVPRTRGAEVCRDPDAIAQEVRSLVGRGYPEVMLLGQTVNAYRYGGLDFADLLARVDAIEDFSAFGSRRHTPSTWTRGWRAPCAICRACARTSTCPFSPDRTGS